MNRYINNPFVFVYEKNTLDTIQDYSVEAIVSNSWEAPWHSIRDIDKVNHIIYIDSKDYFDSPGDWFLDYNTEEASYYSNKNENPNKLKFIIPVLDTLLIMKGSAGSKIYVRNVKSSNIRFSHSRSKWGYNNVEEKYNVANSKTFSWLILNEGFSPGQTSPKCGAPILLARA